LGDKEFACGLTYTALSRCKTLENMAFDPMPGYERISGIKKHKLFIQRKKEEIRLQKIEDATLEQFNNDMLQSADDNALALLFSDQE
jgi:hypothetical protein